MSINKLDRVIVSHGVNGTQTSRLPDNEEMMNKINEIVELVNKIERVTLDANMLKGRN